MRGRNERRQGRGRGAAIAALCCTLTALSGAVEARLQAVPIEPEAAAETAPARAPEPAPAPPGEVRGALYDRSNGDLERLQTPREAMQGLPRDADGKVDWMSALRKGAIAPRGKFEMGDGDHLTIDLDVIMRNTKEMPHVRFPHRAHSEWLACSNCHPALFEAKAGSTRIKMEDIFRGHYCGTCHDRVAFVTHRNCYRCHSVPQPPKAATGY